MSDATIGIQPDAIRTATQTAAFRLGTRAVYDDPAAGTKEYIYGKANAAITAQTYCVESTGNTYDMITTALTAPGASGHGSRVGVAQATLAINQYGWFQVFGKANGNTLASAAKGTRMNTTATAGALDDDGTAGSRAVNGVVLGTATGGAQANNADTYLNYPTVGVTL